jgi:hypothetical protein
VATDTSPLYIILFLFKKYMKTKIVLKVSHLHEVYFIYCLTKYYYFFCFSVSEGQATQ